MRQKRKSFWNGRRLRRFPITAILCAILSGCGTGLRLQDPLVLTASVGFTARHSFRFSASFSSTPSCKIVDTNQSLAVSHAEGDWYAVSGLTEDTSYSVRCETSAEGTEFQARTFGSVETLIPYPEGVDQDGTVYSAWNCGAHMRTVSYNQGNGRLMFWGQTAKVCYGEYDGTQWKFVVLPVTDPEVSSQVYQMGTGLVSLSDGTVYALSIGSASGNTFNRLFRCRSECGTAESWEVAEFDNTLFTGFGTNLAVSPSDGYLVAVSNSGTLSQFSVCPLTSDCLILSNWSSPLTLSASVGANRQSSAYFDSEGNLWVKNFHASTPLWFCPAASFQTGQCGVIGNWSAGGLRSGAVLDYAEYPHFSESGGKLNILTRYSSGAFYPMLFAECTLSSGNCGAVSGGIFTNFTTAVQDISTGFRSTRDSSIHLLADGFAVHFRDATDSSKTKWQKCSGSLSGCSTATWSTAALVPDGQNHAWETYFARSGFSDQEGAAAALLSQTAKPMELHYFE